MGMGKDCLMWSSSGDVMIGVVDKAGWCTLQALQQCYHSYMSWNWNDSLLHWFGQICWTIMSDGTALKRMRILLRLIMICSIWIGRSDYDKIKYSVAIDFKLGCNRSNIVTHMVSHNASRAHHIIIIEINTK